MTQKKIEAAQLDMWDYFTPTIPDEVIKEIERDMWMIDATPLDMVKEFSLAMDQPLGEEWELDEGSEPLRSDLIFEEYCEVQSGTEPEEILKELADLVYVTYGYAATFGWNLDEAIRRVHESNMSKLVEGKPLKRADGKVLKGPYYKPPTMEDLV